MTEDKAICMGILHTARSMGEYTVMIYVAKSETREGFVEEGVELCLTRSQIATLAREFPVKETDSGQFVQPRQD